MTDTETVAVPNRRILSGIVCGLTFAPFLIVVALFMLTGAQFSSLSDLLVAAVLVFVIVIAVRWIYLAVFVFVKSLRFEHDRVVIARLFSSQEVTFDDTRRIALGSEARQMSSGFRGININVGKNYYLAIIDHNKKLVARVGVNKEDRFRVMQFFQDHPSKKLLKVRT